uniref:Tyr recombinase domain-containing protein n=1 Tax=Flavobacterium columnare TaxID=996 RepID=A0AA94F2B2_9FLAO
MYKKNYFNIAYGCGLRVQEISDLNKEDIRIIENLVIVQKGKNSKRRLVPLTDKITNELNEYLESLKHKTNEFLINNKARRMSDDTINKHFKKLLLKQNLVKN